MLTGERSFWRDLWMRCLPVIWSHFSLKVMLMLPLRRGQGYYLLSESQAQDLNGRLEKAGGFRGLVESGETVEGAHLKCSFFQNVCVFVVLSFPWWRRTKCSTVEWAVGLQTQCLCWEFLSQAPIPQTHSNQDKVKRSAAPAERLRYLSGPAFGFSAARKNRKGSGPCAGSKQNFLHINIRESESLLVRWRDVSRMFTVSG